MLPNDGQCHLNKDREYDKATVLDYPSVSQIRDRIQQNNIFVIFAVTRQHKSLYGRLAQKIGSDLASVSIITEEDSSSVTKVIEQEYQVGNKWSLNMYLGCSTQYNRMMIEILVFNTRKWFRV